MGNRTNIVHQSKHMAMEKEVTVRKHLHHKQAVQDIRVRPSEEEMKEVAQLKDTSSLFKPTVHDDHSLNKEEFHDLFVP